MDREARLDLMLEQWERAQRAGRTCVPADLCADCPELESSLAARIQALQQMGEILGLAADDTTPHVSQDPANAAPPDLEPSVTRYQMVRFHARGGLGEVYLARDESLGRDVALKRIQPEKAREDVNIRRFARETAITGHLEHPGVVPVYNRGQDSQGRPYYTMRFIRGQTLAHAVQHFHEPENSRAPSERVVAFRALLSRFISVCQTVAYAHNQGFIHRDLKPDNIMLGPFGETLVVDWGLARTLKPIAEDPLGEIEADSPDHLSLGVIGTPRYMSPEQANGEPVGPASDIYSLGATLYAVLTGSPAIAGGSLSEILEAARSGKVVPPSVRRPELSRDLEAICMKALARDPADRYETAQALAQDLERWLADEPVTARAEPLSHKARRWARKRRTAVTGTIAALTVALLGLVLLLAVQGRANRALGQETKWAEDSETLAIEAIRKFRDVVANDEELRNTPALEGLRRRLLEQPLSFFRSHRARLEAARTARPTSMERIAEAAHDLAETTEELGNLPNALRAHREALAFYTDLVRGGGATTRTLRNRADALEHVGKLLGATGLTDEAQATLEQASSLLETLVRANPADEESLHDLAGCRHKLGVLLHETGRYESALRAHESARELWRRMGEGRSNSEDGLVARASLEDEIGLNLAALGKPSEAQAAHEKARSLFQKLVDAHPERPSYARDLAFVNIHLANIALSTHDASGAEHPYEAARQVLATLVDAHPTAPRFQRDLASVLDELGLLQSETNQMEKALETYRGARQKFQRLADDHPSVRQYQSDLAIHLSRTSSLLLDLGRREEAIADCEAALAIRRQLVEGDPLDQRSRRDLGFSYHNLGAILEQQERVDEALKALRESLALRQRLVADYPTIPGYLHELTTTQVNLGSLRVDRGELEEGRTLFQEAITHLGQLVADDPNQPEYLSALAATLHNVASIDMRQEHREKARPALRQAIVLQRKALSLQPENQARKHFLAAHLKTLEAVCEGLALGDEAAEARRELAELVGPPEL